MPAGLPPAVGLPNLNHWHCIRVGESQTPVLVIDDVLPGAAALLDYAGTQAFSADAANFYPGVRCPAPAGYALALQALWPLVSQIWPRSGQCGASGGFSEGSTADGQPWRAMLVRQAAFAITTTAPRQLRPIQMLPHIDTAGDDTLALVHYLMGSEHGGTSFYRHRSSGLERISETALPGYAAALKQEALAQQLHLTPGYQAGDSALFQRIGQVEAQFNRALIYPANLLHSGDILQALSLEQNPQAATPAGGRLTVSCLLQLQY